jgi:hypothetical protein
MSQRPAPKLSQKSILRPRQPRFIKPLSIDLSHRIPPELIEVIIQKLDFDIPTLAVCCLVSKAWLACSRHRLCPRVSLNHRNARDFFQLLDSPHSTISQGIRHISIEYTSSVAISHRSYHKKLKVAQPNTGRNSDPVFHFDEALPRLSTFGCLTSLCFSWVEHGLGLIGSTSLMRNFLHLTEIEFRACTFPSFTEFTDIICALQNLRRVVLSDVEWVEIYLETQSKHKLPPHLQIVELYIARISHVLDWLMLDGAMLSIETVKLGSVFWEDTDTASIARFLRRLGPKLQHLTLPWHLLEGVSRCTCSCTTFTHTYNNLYSGPVIQC